MTRIWAMVALALALGGEGRAEELTVAAPQGFQLDLAIATHTAQIREFLPIGQSRETWQERVIVQRFPGLSDLDPDQFLSGVANRALADCGPGGSAEVIALSTSGAMVRVTCQEPREMGQTETFIAKAVPSEAGLTIVQAVWRGDASPETMARWLNYLLEVCPGG
ncbi:MAG: hypothetical protein AAGA70_08270 [Pseudomonadota bacterium]